MKPQQSLIKNTEKQTIIGRYDGSSTVAIIHIIISTMSFEA